MDLVFLNIGSPKGLWNFCYQNEIKWGEERWSRGREKLTTSLAYAVFEEVYISGMLAISVRLLRS
jgi:hypothetical protein